MSLQVIHPFVLSISKEELSFIAALDYGCDSARHLAALDALIFEQGGILHAGQHWFPYEVIELGSNIVQVGHEREFVICTLLVIAAIKSGFDYSRELGEMLNDRSVEYDQLSSHFAAVILNEFIGAELSK